MSDDFMALQYAAKQHTCKFLIIFCLCDTLHLLAIDFVIAGHRFCICHADGRQCEGILAETHCQG